MDRLARNLGDLLGLVKGLNDRGVVITFHKENITFTGAADAMAMMMLSVMGAVAQFERSMILERQKEGIAIAKSKGVYKGRAAVLNATQIEEIKARLAAGESKVALAKEFQISRQTLYSAIR